MCFAWKYFLLVALIIHIWGAQKTVPAQNQHQILDSKDENTGGLEIKQRSGTPGECELSVLENEELWN